MALRDYLPARFRSTKGLEGIATKGVPIGASVPTVIPAAMRQAMAFELGAIKSEAPKTDLQRIDIIERHPVAYWCTRKIATATGSVPWAAIDPATGQPDHEHPLTQILNNPNPLQSRSDLFQSMAASLAATGNAYLYGVRSQVNGEPIGLFCLRPDRVRIQTLSGDSTQIDYYDYTSGSGNQRFTPDQLCHVRHQWLSRDAAGYAPIDSVWESADTFAGYVRLSRKILQNSGGIPGALVFSSQKGLSVERRAELQEHITRFRLDGDKFGQLLLLDLDEGGTMNFVPLAGDISKMSPREGKSDAAREICLAFGVPPVLYTAAESGPTYSNYQEANRAFWYDTLIPGYVDAIGSALSRYFQVEIRADLSEVPALSKFNAETVAALAQLDGVLTINEKRARLGYGAHAMGDRIIVNPAAIALDTQLAVTDARTVMEVDPALLAGILEADAQSRAAMSKMLALLDAGTTPGEIKARIEALAGPGAPKSKVARFR